ncbi:MAG: SET domain-containing protein-lysine N-methyltransferase [Bacteroidetes bacterium]|nr:SET domain-containing protein-lysine N-methyltransferase [Bacteroidota bacterium]
MKSGRKVNLGESRITGAGTGLFAAEDIKRGYLIVNVIGPRFSVAQIEETESANDYLLEINDGSGDCIEVQGEARYANDAKGRTTTPGMVNNAQFCSADDHSMYLEATRSIKSGEEILVNYGKGYWI